jgi:ribosomal protein L31
MSHCDCIKLAPLSIADYLEMKKGLHPQLQWISYVTQSGRLMHVSMTKIHHVGKVYHFRAKRQMAESLGQIAKFKRRFEGGNEKDN